MVPEEPEASAWSRRRQGLSKLRSQGGQGVSITAGGLHSHLQESWGQPEVGHPGRMDTPGTRPLGVCSKPRGPPAPAAVSGVPLCACGGVRGYRITRVVQKHRSRDRKLLRAPQTPFPRCSSIPSSTLPPLPSPEGKKNPSAAPGVSPPPAAPLSGTHRSLPPTPRGPQPRPAPAITVPGEKLPTPGNPRRPQPYRGEEVEDGAPGVPRGVPTAAPGARPVSPGPAGCKHRPGTGDARARRFRPRPSGKSAPSMQMSPHAKDMQIKPSSQIQRSLRSSPQGVGCTHPGWRVPGVREAAGWWRIPGNPSTSHRILRPPLGTLPAGKQTPRRERLDAGRSLNI